MTSRLIARADDVLRVPNSALRFRPAGTEAAEDRHAPGSRVWVLREEGVLPVVVRTGLSDGVATAVLAGELAEQARVITGGGVEGAAAPQASGSPLLPLAGTRRGAGSGQRGDTGPAGERR